MPNTTKNAQESSGKSGSLLDADSHDHRASFVQPSENPNTSQPSRRHTVADLDTRSNATSYFFNEDEMLQYEEHI